jgi:mannitol-1-/sugar-/sorbitol-6-/2-deoxyglucose-6-phosphatase
MEYVLPPTIKAVIFDMDGLLIDSEPYWKIAEKKVFGKLGLTLTDELLARVMGFRLNEVVHYWYNYQPWPNPDFAQTEQEILTEVQQLILEHAEPLPGVHQIISYLHSLKMPMAVASSSAMSLIQAVVQKLEVANCFNLLWSAEFEPYGKPHPGIFLTTSKQLGISPEHCLVFEDSVNGVIAAKAARMVCVAVPEKNALQDIRFSIADAVVTSLVSIAIAR